MERVLVLNLGIDSMQGTVFDESGAAVITIQKKIDLFTDEENVEQDPEQWYDAACDIISQACRNIPDNNIESITLTYRPGTFVCIDNMGNHLMNAILQCDGRAKYQARICDRNIRSYYEDYNIPWGYMVLPKILWIKYNKPDIYKNIFKILTPDGYLAYRLCGETAIDSFSALFMGYNLKNSAYNMRILEEMNLDLRMFPDVRKAGESVGVISGEIREKLNLKSDVKFVLSTNNMVSLSMLCTDSKKSVLYDMDSSSICFADRFFKLRKESGLIRLPLSERNLYLYGFMGNHEMQFLKWINEFASGDDEPVSDYTPGCHGLIALPYIMGENVFNNSDLRASIIGIGSNTRKSDIMAACYESAGYILKEKIENISHHDVQIDSVEIISHIKDELFYHVLSDITSKNIIVNNIQDYCSRGAYYIIAKEEYKDEDEKTNISPDEEKVHSYRQFYNLYRSTCDSLNDTFKYRRRILKRLIL